MENGAGEVTAHISTDNIEAGTTAAKEMAALLGDSGKVAVFVHDSLSMTAKEREQGFLDELAKHASMEAAVIYRFDELEDMAKLIAEEKNSGLAEDDVNRVLAEDFSQEDVITYILENNPDLKGIFTSNLDTTQLLADVLSDLEYDDLAFIGFDGGKNQIELLTDDVVDGLILQNPYGMGYATVVAAGRTILDIGNEAFIDSGYAWVTKANMENATVKKFIY